MGNKLHSKAVRATIEITGKQFCTNCRAEQDRKGGVWIVSKNKLNRRWKCQACHHRALARSAGIQKDQASLPTAVSLTNPCLSPAIAGRKNDYLPSPGADN